jgi:hypothetical protein
VKQELVTKGRNTNIIAYLKASRESQPEIEKQAKHPFVAHAESAIVIED